MTVHPGFETAKSEKDMCGDPFLLFLFFQTRFAGFLNKKTVKGICRFLVLL